MRERVREAAKNNTRPKWSWSAPRCSTSSKRNLMLQTVDQHWREHLAALDHLRQGIHLRGYAQKNPKQEYKREAFELFSDMLDRIKQDVVKIVLTVRVQTPEDVRRSRSRLPVSNVRYQHADYEQALAAAPDDPPPPTAPPPFTRAGQKVGRNDHVPVRLGARSTSTVTADSLICREPAAGAGFAFAWFTAHRSPGGLPFIHRGGLDGH